MAGSGTLPSISDWLYGSTVSCVTSSGEAITGEVYTFDSASDTVVLREFHVLRPCHLENVRSVSVCDHGLQQRPCPS